MLKGKTILSDIEQFGIKSTVVSSTANTPNTTSLKPKKIINETSSVEPIYSLIKTSKIISPVTELEFDKTIIQNERTSNEIITRTQNIRYTLEELKTRFPGYNSLYYTEIFDLLQSTDYNLDLNNLTSNIQKFIHLGNNIQSQISRLHNIEILRRISFNSIKEKYSNQIGFFTSDDNFKTIFTDFNDELSDYYGTLYKEINNLRTLDFDKFNLINLYFDFFLFISDELQNKNLIDTSGIIQSRVLSLNNSKTVLEQFKNLIQIEIQGKDIEYNNIKNYLDVLNPSLHLLRTRNFKEFKEQFKSSLRIL
jgi:hypothetical protein